MARVQQTPLSAYIIDENNLSKINISLGTQNRRIPPELLGGIDYFMGLKIRGNMSQVLKIVPLEDIIVKKGAMIERGKGISILNSNPPNLKDGFNSIIGPNTFGEFRKKKIIVGSNDEYEVKYDHATALKQLKDNKENLKKVTHIKDEMLYVAFVYADGNINIEEI